MTKKKEDPVASKKPKDIDEFAQNLVKKIKSYLKKNNHTVQASVENVISISNTEDWAEVKCVYCDETLKCKFRSVWKNSNYFRHLRSHPPASPQEQIAVPNRSEEHYSDRRPAEVPNEVSLQFERARSTVLTEVRNVITNVIRFA